jgi:hypothetical protein
MSALFAVIALFLWFVGTGCAMCFEDEKQNIYAGLTLILGMLSMVFAYAAGAVA